MISSELTELILRNNIYDQNAFSNASHLFYGVRKLPGKLDLQNSLFQLIDEQEGNCLFNVFQQIKILDLSSVKFQGQSNETEFHLTYLLKCETLSDGTRNGEQLLDLYLRQLQLKRLPEWFTNDRFPLLRRLDLSNNNIYSIDIGTFATLRHVSLAYNPIELDQIIWRNDTIYESINLRSTIRNRTFDLSDRLKDLLKLTADIDYSENEGISSSNLRTIPIEIDFPIGQFSLNLSRTNINSFEVIFNDLLRLDISSNSLIELNLDEYRKLNSLDCSNQYIKMLKFNEQLSELKCSNNSLKTIENFSLSKSEQLKLIDLSNNSINSLENLFTNLTSRFLRIINLKYNSIEIIPSNIFHRKLISLYEINLSWNRIHTIQKNAFQTPNLQILDLTGNPLINIEPNAILTASLRLFYVFNNTQEINERCLQSKSYDNLLFLYINWFKTNGSLMKNDQIEFDQCLNRYFNQTKINLIITKGKHYILYVLISLGVISVLFGGIYLYQRNKLTFFARFQRYRRLDRNILNENGTEMDQHLNEDEEIVMNLQEPPFNKSSPVQSYV